MYARAREGRIKGFTGLDDPYEPPTGAEIVLDTVQFSAEKNARQVLSYCIERGVVLRSLSPKDGQPAFVMAGETGLPDAQPSGQLEVAKAAS